jgi:ATP-dependent Clp protease ATP-binding subunit ClpX
MADTGNPDPLRCSFYGKSQKQVKKLIAGPRVFICDECVDLSTQLVQGAILEKDLPQATALKLEERPTPQAVDEGDHRTANNRRIRRPPSRVKASCGFE